MRRLVFFLAAACLAQPPPPTAPPAAAIEQEQLRQLLGLRRVYVDRLGGSSNTGPLRDMILSALHRARLFVVTEDESHADAYLRGAAEDLIFTEVRSVREGVQVRAGSVGIGDTDDRYSRERKHEAVAAIRLVARNGDVLWSTTQESLGAKYKGSSADVADKVVRDLEAAFAKARKGAGR